MRTEPPIGDDLTRMLVSMKQNILDGASQDPAPARRRARNRAIITGTAILLTLGLGAGAAIAAGMISEDEPPATQPEPTAAGTATPTPTPRSFAIETAPPVDPLTTVTTIVIRPDGLELTDESGTLVRTLSYNDDGATVAAVLTTVFDEEPEVREDYSPGARLFKWDGLSISEHWESGNEFGTRLAVGSSLPTLGDGVAVTTSSGFSAGDEPADFAAATGQNYDIFGRSGPDSVILEVGPNASVRATANTNYGGRVSVVYAPDRLPDAD